MLLSPPRQLGILDHNHETAAGAQADTAFSLFDGKNTAKYAT
jgi:hypothetical protein